MFSPVLSTIPESLHEPCHRFAKQWQAQGLAPVQSDWLHALATLVAFSDYAAWAFLNEPDRLTLFEQIDSSITKQRLESELSGFDTLPSIEEAKKRLRHIRHRWMLIVMARFYLGKSSMELHVQELSDVAQVLIEHAHRWAQHHVKSRLGELVHEGRQHPMVIVALGKLGGHELNYSSDVDLILCYPHQGMTQGGQVSVDDQKYYTQVAQWFIQLLSDVTEDGFVYRTDLRLRPFGSASSLVIPFDALEHYYQTQGRDWERYAFCKATILTDDHQAKAQLRSIIQPFVYRKYMDFTAMHAIHQMKQDISEQARRKGQKDDLKVGLGGIRHVEFIIQMFQMIFGGKDPSLQSTNALDTLTRLSQKQIIEPGMVDALKQAYVFLRKSEHIVQMIHDAQTHALPKSRLDRQRLAHAMGFGAYEDFHQTLKGHQAFISQTFDELGTPYQQSKPSSPKAQMAHQIWDQCGDEVFSKSLISKIHVSPAFFKSLSAFKHSKLVSELSPKAKERLWQFMPNCLSVLLEKADKETALIRLIEITRSIARRSSYLLMFNEHPMALKPLIEVCAQSEKLSHALTLYPLLLDELVSPSPLHSHLEQLDAHLERILVHANDMDEQMESLRQFKLSYEFQIAYRELMHEQKLSVGALLSDLAEVIVSNVIQLSSRYVLHHEARFKSLNVSPNIHMIAYGNLGARDLHYDSDLDLVFVFDDRALVDTHVQDFVYRVAQRAIHMLSTTTLKGKLYEVDVRLRPSGASGLLVTGIQAFETYLKEQAWVFEHQALVRARMISCDPRICDYFQQVREQVLTQARDLDELKKQVIDMREKMSAHRSSTNTMDIKFQRGGLIDIEFIIQYLVLAHAHQHPDLTGSTNSHALLGLLGQYHVLNEDAVRYLQEARISYLPGRSLSKAALDEKQQNVRQIWQGLFHCP